MGTGNQDSIRVDLDDMVITARVPEGLMDGDVVEFVRNEGEDDPLYTHVAKIVGTNKRDS